MNNTQITIEEANTPEHTEQVRALLRVYGAAQGLTEQDSPRYFEDLLTLPGRYAKPNGGLWLAQVAGVSIGCGGLTPIENMPATGELKRLYVSPQFRGIGLGKRLVQTILASAERMGYAQVVLSTRSVWREAYALYKQLGFTHIAPFKPRPAGMRDLIFMGKQLAINDE